MAGKTPKKSTKVAKKPAATKSKAGPASNLIDRRIRELGDWRGATLQRVRAIIHAGDPEIVEEWKWETLFERIARTRRNDLLPLMPTCDRAQMAHSV